MNKKIKVWVEALRPRTLPVSMSGVIIALGLAKWQEHFRLVPALLCLAFAVLAQIVSNLANEYFDFKAGTDKKGRAGFRRGVTEGDIKPGTMKRVMIGTLAVTCLVGLSMLFFIDGTSNQLMLIGVGVLVAIFALAYSAGPYPLSYHALGEVAVMIFYGLVPVIFTYYVVAQRFDILAILASVAIGFMGVNVLLVNNYRDMEDDKEANKRTSVVVFGRTAAAFAYLANGYLAIAVLGGLWVLVCFNITPWILIVPLIYLILHCITWWKIKHNTGAALNPLLGETARNMLIFTILLVGMLLAF